jgi:hypothetical protein
MELLINALESGLFSTQGVLVYGWVRIHSGLGQAGLKRMSGTMYALHGVVLAGTAHGPLRGYVGLRYVQGESASGLLIIPSAILTA